MKSYKYVKYVVINILFQVIHYFWQPLPSLTLWQLSEEDRNLILVLLITHLLCWVLIASSVFTIDYLELMGFKQVMGKLRGLTSSSVVTAYDFKNVTIV